MNSIAYVILAFSLLGALDHLFGNRLGVGQEFVKGFSLFCPMALSMLGMIVIAPALGVWLLPFFDGFYRVFGIDPSVIPASLFANDMGGAALATAIMRDGALGGYNAFVVSSMMGCVISFTIPFSLGLVKRQQHRELFFGILCGIATIPVGCFVSGLCLGIGILPLFLDLLPLVILSSVIAAALLFFPAVCIRCFTAFGEFMRALAIVGLGIAVFTFLTKIELSPYFDTMENAALVCVNACVTLSGALPAMYLIGKLLKKPLALLGGRIGINETATLALLGTLVTNASTFGVMDKMDRRGVVLNSAFAVSAAFVFGGHLAFTMAYDAAYVPPMIVGKLVSGVCALLLAYLLYRPQKSPCGE